MRRVLLAVAFVVLSFVVGLAQSGNSGSANDASAAPADTSQNAPPAPAGTIRGTFPVALQKTLDSKKLKAGDAIVSQTTATLQLHGAMIPSGAKVLGHVTQATARSAGA